MAPVLEGCVEWRVGPAATDGVFKAALLGHFQCLTQNHNACALDVPPVKMY